MNSNNENGKHQKVEGDDSQLKTLTLINIDVYNNQPNENRDSVNKSKQTNKQSKSKIYRELYRNLSEMYLIK